MNIERANSRGKAVSNKINLLIMGVFTYPLGMAGTKRIQNAINALKQYPDIQPKVVLQRQSSGHNILSGIHEGTPYETIMGDLLRAKMFVLLPVLWYRTIAVLKKSFRPGHKNVIYFYGPLFLESTAPLVYARKLGYKIVFDVIEDYSLTTEVSRSFYHYMRSKLSNWLSSQIKNLSSGVIVISSYLEEKCKKLTHGKVPLHFMPISVDIQCFPENPGKIGQTVSLFYGGSFGKKDGLPVLLDAFDRLAGEYKHIHLVLTGRGDNEAMKAFFARRDMSPHKDRIDYKGYVDEKDYYSALNNSDIPCMTRTDLAFAHAGFPFKLGEFLATGKPVVASRVSDVEQFLVHRQNAMLVQAGSSTEIYEAVKFLINNPEPAAAMGIRGREVAENFFDFKKQGAALLDFLENI